MTRWRLFRSRIAALDDLCVCGHVRDLHTHLRDGTDCGRCGRAGCARFKADRSAPALVTCGDWSPLSKNVIQTRCIAPAGHTPATAHRSALGCIWTDPQ